MLENSYYFILFRKQQVINTNELSNNCEYKDIIKSNSFKYESPRRLSFTNTLSTSFRLSTSPATGSKPIKEDIALTLNLKVSQSMRKM